MRTLNFEPIFFGVLSNGLAPDRFEYYLKLRYPVLQVRQLSACVWFGNFFSNILASSLPIPCILRSQSASLLIRQGEQKHFELSDHLVPNEVSFKTEPYS